MSGPKKESAEDAVRRSLRRQGLRPRKSLGQHFLIDPSIGQAAVSAAALSRDDAVIEVGPGLGALTEAIAAQAGHVIAVEADEDLVAMLRKRLASFKNLTVINADILQTRVDDLLRDAGCEGCPYKVVANLPYYITSPVLRHFLGAASRPSLMVVMVQREVAETITAASGDYSLLTVSVRLYGVPEIVGLVPPSAFSPPPKVHSAILRIRVYDRPAVDQDEHSFFQTARAGFSAPRKQLRNALSRGLGISADEAAALLSAAGIDFHRRAEDLSLQEWACLSKIVSGTERVPQDA